MSLDAGKSTAAYKAVEEELLPLLQAAHGKGEQLIVGIGSGSTVVFVVEAITKLDPKLTKPCIYVPTSFQAKHLILDAGLTLGSIETVPYVDIAIDGADEVDSQLNSIKGGGACHLQEKLVAKQAKKFIIVADYTKDSKVLGEQWSKGIPLEVVPLGVNPVLNTLKQMGATGKLRMSGGGKAGPVVTDHGNLVIDAHFSDMSKPVELEKDLKLICGVVEVGLFTNICNAAYFGNLDGTSVKRLPPQ